MLIGFTPRGHTSGQALSWLISVLSREPCSHRCGRKVERWMGRARVPLPWTSCWEQMGFCHHARAPACLTCWGPWGSEGTSGVPCLRPPPRLLGQEAPVRGAFGTAQAQPTGDPLATPLGPLFFPLFGLVCPQFPRKWASGSLQLVGLS